MQNFGEMKIVVVLTCARELGPELGAREVGGGEGQNLPPMSTQFLLKLESPNFYGRYSG